LFVPSMAVFADGADYSDYVPGDMPTDLVTENWPYDGSTGSVTFGWSGGAYGTETQWKANTDISCTAETYYGAMGSFIRDYGSKDKISGTLELNTAYVFSAKIKNAGAEGTSPKFGIWFWKTEKIGENTHSYKTFPVEYGADGYAPGFEFEDYNATIVTPSHETGDLQLGLGMVTAANGDILQLDWSEEVYFAKEEAYNITNEVVGSSRIFSGNSVTLDAKVVNQVGSAGTLDQAMTFVALDENRTTPVDGFTFITNGDGTTTVEVADSVEAGKYVLLAQSGVYSGFQKGVEIEVVDSDKFTDYTIGEKPANLISSGWVFGNNTGSLAGSTWVNGVYGTQVYWTAQNDISMTPTTANWSAIGPIILASKVNGGDPLSPNTGYYTSVRKTNYLSLGFARPDSCIPHTATNAIINMDISNGGSLFVAKETATEITNEVTGDTELLPGESTTVEAEILNQINEQGNVDQGITWFALNADRTCVVDGINITDNGDGTANVDVDEDVETGDYVILAMSDSYPLRKGATISVVNSKARVVFTEIFTVDDGKASVYAGVEGLVCDTVKFVIAAYDTSANKLIDAKEIDVDVVDGIARVESSEIAPVISIDGADLVKVFVWDADTLAPIKFKFGVSNTLWE